MNAGLRSPHTDTYSIRSRIIVNAAARAEIHPQLLCPC